MSTVTIAGVSPDPEIFGTLAGATSYIGATFSPEATKWRGLSPDDKNRCLVSGTRYLDTLGLVSAGLPIGHDTIITNVINASYEMSMAIAADPSIATAIDAGNNVRLLDASGAKIEFFRPTSAADGTATLLPVRVQKLLAPYLPATSASVSGSSGSSYGVDGESTFDDCDGTDRNQPF